MFPSRSGAVSFKAFRTNRVKLVQVSEIEELNPESWRIGEGDTRMNRLEELVPLNLRVSAVILDCPRQTEIH
jgi:hypothetical protein